MSRRIRRIEVLGGGAAGDTYFDKILKYIPADIVGAWVAITGVIAGASQPKPAVLWVVFLIMLAITPAWTWKQTKEPNKPPAKTQILVATGSFFVWVFALGGPFTSLSFYTPLYGSLALIIYTLLVGLVTPREP
jgi:hypothetical protein